MNAQEKFALADRAYETAVCYELDYGCCPQCVLSAIQETVGLVDDQTIKELHAHAWVVAGSVLDHFHALFDAEKRLFTNVSAYSNDNRIKYGRSTFDDIKMSTCNGIKGTGVDGKTVLHFRTALYT